MPERIKLKTAVPLISPLCNNCAGDDLFYHPFKCLCPFLSTVYVFVCFNSNSNRGETSSFCLFKPALFSHLQLVLHVVPLDQHSVLFPVQLLQLRAQVPHLLLVEMSDVGPLALLLPQGHQLCLQHFILLLQVSDFIDEHGKAVIETLCNRINTFFTTKKYLAYSIHDRQQTGSCLWL